MTLRLSLTLLALLLTVISSWWISGLVLLLFIFIYPRYYEAVLVALVYDLLYGANNFWLTLVVLFIIPLVGEIKRRLYVFN